MPAPQITTPDLTAATRASRGADTTRGNQHHLKVDGVSHAYGERRVLSDISFTAKTGDRVGLIGENGTGKSTLLRILAGSEAPNAGTIRYPGSVGMLTQELPYPDGTEMSQVLDDAQRSTLQTLQRIEQLGAAFGEHPDDPAIATSYAEALERAEHEQAWAAEARRGDMLTGLGLGGIEPCTRIGRLSGGQRLRLALATVLLKAPHTLLLDEPSNHLDDASAAYLERVLRQWSGIVFVASHDRALLDAVTTRILDLDPVTPITQRTTLQNDDPGAGLGLRAWGMGYSAAREARRAEMERWRARYVAESEEHTALVHEIEVGSREVNRKHESKSESRITRKFYADKDARVTARRARNARVRLETLERDRVRRPPEPLRFRGFAQGPERTTDGTEAVLQAHEVALDARLSPVSFALKPGGRLMLTGPNGAGKSTLLAILAGKLQPSKGSVQRASVVGYLPQEVTFKDSTQTARETYRRAVGTDVAEEYPLAETGLLAVRDQDRPVAALSVGQRRRLALAALVADPPPVLLLDEPTNHLSLTLVEELEEALQSFEGALIIATHDRWLRSRWSGEVLAM
ncbi:ABC-F family ATP-binding cassette domain-containing protein [Leucobacter coleopterorum]|uniref:ABC-F family ATP-binding cassette domain-containing protein n=1 Tax=Leucobacter coleopterorum TaxID=2714933 RepID=A0ABX6JZ45_9MICO|nr:ABC-F family ATP-binding cassette domain-containing protein [Leucobacter coleopterorum]QIM19186.1 ABC-F family ATP-binding cassette domain-containing protein [Leucobacter coleopterorum]